MNNTTKKLAKYVGAVFTVIAFYYLFLTLTKNYKSITIILASNNFFFIILVGLCLYAITQLNLVIAWQLLLRNKYPNIKFKTFYYIIGISQIGKYLPGNIGHVIGRVVLAQKYKIKIVDSSKSLFYESILVIFAGMLVSFGYFHFYEENILGLNIIIFKILFTFIALAIFTYIVKTKNNKSNRLYPRSIFLILLLYIFSFIVLGLILFITQYFIATEHISLIQYTIVITISFIAGYIMPGSPAGIGIREFVFISLVSTEIDPSISLTLILFLRLITTIGDILMYLISLKIKTNLPYS